MEERIQMTASGNVTRQDLVVALHSRLMSADVDSDALLSSAVEVVIFGSRAAGVNGDCSDLDVLCFTECKKRIKTHELDFISYPKEEMNSSYWRGCELANHIARYGVWIVGSGAWRTAVRVSNAAIQRKQRKVGSLVAHAYLRWQQFHPLFRAKYATSIRRELQRLNLLETGIPIPPTPFLDQQWSLLQISSEQLLNIARGVPGLVPRYSHWMSYILERANASGPAKPRSTLSLRSQSDTSFVLPTLASP